MSVEQWSDLLFSEAEPCDRHVIRKVKAVNEDGSYMVQLNASGTLTRCAPFCTAKVGDRVEVVIKANGKCDAIGRLGGDIGGSDEPAKVEIVDTVIEGDMRPVTSNAVAVEMGNINALLKTI